MIFQDKKTIYLNRGKAKEKKEKKRIQLHFPFLTALINKELKIKPGIFLGLSIASALIVWFLYKTYTKSDIVSICGGLMAFFIPYLFMETPLMINKQVDNALQYKEFINTLQSSLKATNSTHEAIYLVAKEKGMNKEMREVVQQIVSDLTLGDSIESALDKAIDATENVYLKMALSIVKINHNVGSSKTIASLDNILKAQDMVMDNVALLKDKINSIVFEKALFGGAIIACPVIHVAIMSSMIGDFYTINTWQWVTVFMLLFAYAGQFVMNYSAMKAMKEL